MEYQVQHYPERARFEVCLEGHIAYLEYELNGKDIEITHTVVPALLEGKGIASALMKQALNYAERQHLNVVPICSFAVTYMHRHR